MRKRIIRELLGVVLASAGAYAGFVAYRWMLSHGYHALVLPGALLGLGAGVGAGSKSTVRGLVCAAAALVFGLYVVWCFWSIGDDGTLASFVTKVHKLSPPTMIMLAAGCLLAYWMGRDPVTTLATSSARGTSTSERREGASRPE